MTLGILSYSSDGVQKINKNIIRRKTDLRLSFVFISIGGYVLVLELKKSFLVCLHLLFVFNKMFLDV